MTAVGKALIKARVAVAWTDYPSYLSRFIAVVRKGTVCAFRNSSGAAYDPADKKNDQFEKETIMPYGIPSVALLRDTFRRAVTQALGKCEETHTAHYRSRCRFLASTPWVEIGPNVQAIQATETEFLIRGSWQYTIDLGTKDQLPIALAQINAIASLLASAVPRGEPVKGTFDFPPSETSASREKITCAFRGVVRGQVPCANTPCLAN